MLDYGKTRAFDSGPVRQAYAARDTMLYALGLGCGADPLDAAQLRFVYEKELLALPTMAAVLASPGFWMRDRAELGIDAMKIVHGEQSLRMHEALPPAGIVLGQTRVTRVVDKGAGKGAIIHAEKELTDEATGRLLATVESVYFCRGDGGFSQADGQSDSPTEALPATPEDAPEVTLDLVTRPEQALVYRLSGDINPLHADPAMAAKLGFPRPILHGLATWGIAGRALIAAFAGNDPARLTGLRARFSAPVLPGDTLRLEAWKRPEGAAFRLRAVERDLLVLTHGVAVL
ncbi:MAG: MaoC/PaaZ C-terminal domain-containing protein [Ramlibacter sp.]